MSAIDPEADIYAILRRSRLSSLCLVLALTQTFADLAHKSAVSSRISPGVTVCSNNLLNTPKYQVFMNFSQDF
jgi:hypothetical protein